MRTWKRAGTPEEFAMRVRVANFLGDSHVVGYSLLSSYLMCLYQTKFIYAQLARQTKDQHSIELILWIMKCVGLQLPEVSVSSFLVCSKARSQSVCILYSNQEMKYLIPTNAHNLCTMRLGAVQVGPNFCFFGWPCTILRSCTAKVAAKPLARYALGIHNTLSPLLFLGLHCLVAGGFTASRSMLSHPSRKSRRFLFYSKWAA